MFSTTRSFATPGITIRQKLAADAMIGMLSNSIDKMQGQQPFWNMHPNDLAANAIDYADRLIKALNETPNPNAITE